MTTHRASSFPTRACPDLGMSNRQHWTPECDSEKALWSFTFSLFPQVDRPDSQPQSLIIVSSGSACVLIVAAFNQCLHCLYVPHVVRDTQCSACTIYVMLKSFSSCQLRSARIPLLVSHCRALNTSLAALPIFLAIAPENDSQGFHSAVTTIGASC